MLEYKEFRIILWMCYKPCYSINHIYKTIYMNVCPIASNCPMKIIPDKKCEKC